MKAAILRANHAPLSLEDVRHDEPENARCCGGTACASS